MDSADDLDIAAGGSFVHRTPTEGREILDHILGNSSFVAYPCEPQQESQSHLESPSSDESYPSTFQDLSDEPSPEPRISKEEEIELSKLSFQFEDDPYEGLRNTSDYLHYRRPTTPLYPSSKSMNEEWSKEVRRSSKAIQVSSSSTTFYCSIGGNSVEALHDSTVEACIMSEFLMETLIGSMPVDPTDILFRSPSGLFFECRGIAQAVPVKIDKIEVKLDFHIYPILDFEILIGNPLEILLHEKSSQGASNINPGKLLLPLLSLARKIQRWSTISTTTHSKR